MNTIDFGEWLKEKVRATGKSERQFAYSAGLSQGNFNRIVRGERRPKAETLEMIARVLRLPVEEVYRAAGVLKPEPEADPDIERADHYLHNLKNTDTKKFAEAYLKTLFEMEEREALTVRQSPGGGKHARPSRGVEAVEQN